MIFMVNFASVACNLEKRKKMPNPGSSLPFVARDDRKQCRCLNVVLDNKTGALFWNSINAKTRLSGLRSFSIQVYSV